MKNEIEIPVLRNDEDTLEGRMSENGYYNLLPARYQLKDENGNIIEKQEDVFERVAANVALAEAVFEDGVDETKAPKLSFQDVMVNKEFSNGAKGKVMDWKQKFQEHMEYLKFIPNTPTIINAGDEIQQLSACFVDSPGDDMEDIHETAKEAALIFQSGGGCGYDFSHLRPYGDSVGSTGGIASGPITFMQTFDQVCETVAQGGVRRGAQMGTMSIHHPDVIHFIHAKNRDVSLAHTLRLNDPDDPTYTEFGDAIQEARDYLDEYDGAVPKHLRNAVEGHLSNFNISVKVTDEFMDAVSNNEHYTFKNPRTDEPHVVTEETAEMYSWFGIDLEVGEKMTLPANEIWTRVIEGAYENGEPGVIYIDEVNHDHTYDVEEHPEYKVNSTNPCSEQPLMEYEACNLGHINLSTIADWSAIRWDRFTKDGGASIEENVGNFLDRTIDFDELDERIEVGTRFLDNVVTMSDFPIPEIEETVRKNRKIGLGIMGLAQLYIQLGVEYGSPEANEIARQLMRYINHESKGASFDLANERGVFENWEDSKYADPDEHWVWMDRHVGYWEEISDRGVPMRNHNTTTIAPTGSTSILGDTSGGCEPIYNVAYFKNVTDDIQGDEMMVEFDSLFLKALEHNDIDVDEVKEEAQEKMNSNEFDGPESLDTVPDEIARLFVTTSDLTPEQHASVQCALQEGVDSAISKTVNAPHDATLEDAKEVFEYIYENGGKSVTFYRDGSRTKQVNTTRKDNQDVDEDDGEEKEEYQTECGDCGTVEGCVCEDDTPRVEPRERPKTTPGRTEKIDTPQGTLYLTVNEDGNGDPFETFATIGKSGNVTESFSEGLARMISLALRCGISIDEVIRQLENIRSSEVAWDNGDTVESIPDAIALGLKRYKEDEIMKEDDSPKVGIDHPTTDTGQELEKKSGDICPWCNDETLIYQEGCKECPDESCGYSHC